MGSISKIIRKNWDYYLNSIPEIIRNNQLKSYFILTFLISWIFFYFPLFSPLDNMLVNLLVITIGGAGPSLAAIILAGIIKPKKVGNHTLKRRAIFLTVFIVTITLIILYL